MINRYLLKKLLESDIDYWVVSKINDVHGKREEDSIFLIGIPRQLMGYRGRSVNNITLGELDKISNLEVSNISFNEYNPFQWGIVLGSLDDGFPVKLKPDEFKTFLSNCLAVNSSNLYDYKGILNDLANPTESEGEL